ncbi:MAG: S8 family serine peptidase, partial [Micrococcales bacterium]|nr:S8 family serine peptidase [Micrococcales bacterium]
MEPVSTSRLVRGVLAATAVAAVALCQMAVPSTATTAPEPTSKVQGDLRDEALAAHAEAAVLPAADEVVTVIVDLSRPPTMDVPGLVADYDSSSSTGDEAKAAAYRKSLEASQLAVKQAIAGIYPDAQFRHSYTNLLNGFAAKIPYGKIALVEALPGVDSVYIGQTYAIEPLAAAPQTVAVPQTDNGSLNAMNVRPAWNAGFTGAGKIAAVFDSGVWKTHLDFRYMDPAITAAHPDNYKSKADVLAIINSNPSMNLFKNDWGSWFHGWTQTGFTSAVQAQAKAGDFWYNEKIPFEADYVDGTLEGRSSPWASYGSEHGTHVASIAAGNPGPGSLTNLMGVAPDAQIMVFKVFDDYDSFEQESDESVFAALDDAVTLGVNAFNLSLGIPNGFSTAHTYAQAGYMKAYNRAKQHGISVQVSAGNDTRDTNGGSIANIGVSAWRPNSGTVGFSGSLFSPMTVAASSGLGHLAGTLGGAATTTLSIRNMTTGAQIRSIAGPTRGDHTDEDPTRNPWTPSPNAGLQGLVTPGTDPDPVPLVNVGAVTEANILAAAGKTSLTNALVGKVALVNGPITTLTAASKRGLWPEPNAAGKAAQLLLLEAKPAAVIVCNTAASAVTARYPEAFYAAAGVTPVTLPFFGTITSTNCTTIRNDITAAGAVGVGVLFTSARATISAATASDAGPASFTSLGVTDSLDLTPEISAPGTSIYAGVWGNDITSMASMSGTSMASPNSEGAMLLVQQIIDKRIADGDITGIMRGTQEYANLVDQFAASNARTQVTSAGTYWGPRRQGAGVLNVGKVLNSEVSLRSLIPFNAATGQAPRAKLSLGDKLGDTFSFSFAVDNWSAAARTFNVSAVLQRDAYTTNASSQRPVLTAVSSAAAEVARITTGTMNVTSVTNGTLTNGGNNINKYVTGNAPAVVAVPAKTSAIVTVTVNLTGMATLDAALRNGMFLDGFVFLDAQSPATEALVIPYTGFRGDWNATPAFDPWTAYQERTGKPMTDLDYPFYHISALATRAGTAERVVGANAYQGTAFAGYEGSSTSTVSTARTFFDTQRTNGNMTPLKTAFSPNGDGQWDILYANLALLRNTKAIQVIVRDASGAVVKTLGPEYEFFETLQGDGLRTQRAAATWGTKYKRNMGWDGTDEAGKTVPDGSYVYEVRGLLEKAFLDSLDFNASDAEVRAFISGLAADDSRLHMQQFGVKVDTVRPVVSWAPTSTANQIRAVASDASAIQAMGLYINGTLSGSQQVIGTTTVDRTFTLPNGTNLANVTVQAVDYAGNLTAQAQVPVNLKAALQVLVNTYHNLYEVDKDAYTPESYAPLDGVFTLARWWLDTDLVSQSVFNQIAADFAAAVAGLKPVVDFSSLDAAIGAAQMMVDNPSKYVSTHMPALS